MCGYNRARGGPDSGDGAAGEPRPPSCWQRRALAGAGAVSHACSASVLRSAAPQSNSPCSDQKEGMDGNAINRPEPLAAPWDAGCGGHLLPGAHRRRGTPEPAHTSGLLPPAARGLGVVGVGRDCWHGVCSCKFRLLSKLGTWSCCMIQDTCASLSTKFTYSQG